MKNSEGQTTEAGTRSLEDMAKSKRRAAKDEMWNWTIHVNGDATKIAERCQSSSCHVQIEQEVKNKTNFRESYDTFLSAGEEEVAVYISRLRKSWV